MSLVSSKLSAVAHVIFQRCRKDVDPIAGRDIRIDAHGRRICIDNFGDNESPYGWFIRSRNDAYEAVHIEVFLEDVEDHLAASVADAPGLVPSGGGGLP